MSSDPVRLKLASPVDLIANSGENVGRLLAIEVELGVGSGGEGGECFPASSPHPEQQALRLDDAPGSTDNACLGTPSSAAEFQPARASNNVSGAAAQSDADRVQRVWDHYQRVIPNGKMYVLDEKRKRMIRNALATAERQADGFPDAGEYAVSRCCAAIDGLARSPHHNGQNDRSRKYLGIQYALAARGNESIDERLEKMAALAGGKVSDFLAHLPSAGREMVEQHMTKVKASLLDPGNENLRRRAEHSVEYLRKQHGIEGKVGDNGEVVWSRSATS